MASLALQSPLPGEYRGAVLCQSGDGAGIASQRCTGQKVFRVSGLRRHAELYPQAFQQKRGITIGDCARWLSRPGQRGHGGAAAQIAHDVMTSKSRRPINQSRGSREWVAMKARSARLAGYATPWPDLNAATTRVAQSRSATDGKNASLMTESLSTRAVPCQASRRVVSRTGC